MVKDRGYPYIVKWGFLMGSREYYVQEQCDKAASDHAPANATSQNSDGTWSTTDDVGNGPSRVTLGLDPLPPVHPTQLRGYNAEVVGKIAATGADNFLYQIQFPGLYQAARWVRANGIGERARIVGDCTGLPLENHPVRVEFLLDES